ncbi:MAG: BBP7 family outer membrane beta-barrel protein [Pirellulales bacterium]
MSPGHVGSYAQPFAPAETSEFGNGPRAHEGWFFGYQRLVWSLSQPEGSFIGAPPINSFPAFGSNLFNPTNLQTVDHSFIRAVPAWGNRWELGYMDDTSYGWLVSIIDHVSQGQYDTKLLPFITFGDPAGLLEGTVRVPIPDTDPQTFVFVDIGQLPGAFGELQMRNITTLNGVEAMRTYRAPRLHKNGYFEVMYGVRWFQLADGFEFWGTGEGDRAVAITAAAGGGQATGTFPYNMLDESYWGTVVQNNLVGPQIGMRWFAQRGHWITSVEGRFLAAANFQNVHQKTELGTETVDNVANLMNFPTAYVAFRGLGTNTHGYNTTFSPMGELRVSLAYAVTRNISLKVGYDGLVVGNVSRAVNRVDYNSPNLVGITPKSNNEVFFVNGLNFGVEVNR